MAFLYQVVDLVVSPCLSSRVSNILAIYYIYDKSNSLI
jgi:hypothetical protein